MKSITRIPTALTLLMLLLFAPSAATAQAGNVSVTIRFYDQTVYFPDSDIYVKVTVQNESPDAYRFRLADRRVFNLDFAVRTMTNRLLERAPQFTTQRTAHQQVFYREITIAPGERFSFVENLAEYVRIPRSGMYVIEAAFYPELAQGPGERPRIESNRLTLSVRPGTAGRPPIDELLDAETTEILRRHPMPPDQVVEHTIGARQQGQWDRFFLYIDLEELLRADPARERRYLRLSEQDRRTELEEFRDDLRRERTDEDIILVPETYEIVRTEYTPERGTVVVDKRFRFPDYTELKRYTYQLERRDQIWVIVGYNVAQLGTTE